MKYRLDDGRQIEHGAAVKIIAEGGIELRGRLLNVRGGRATVNTADGPKTGSIGCLALCEPWLSPNP
jgi:hypothetical protein